METEVHMRDQDDWHGADDENLGVSVPFIIGSYTPGEGLHGERSSGSGTGR